jgi:hypothetical protein
MGIDSFLTIPSYTTETGCLQTEMMIFYKEEVTI